VSTTQLAPASVTAHRAMAFWRRCPMALGLLGVLADLTGGDRDTVITALFVALGCYLAAAAIDRPWVAWAAVPVASVAVPALHSAAAPAGAAHRPATTPSSCWRTSVC
jgi:hypothetical protein